MILASRRHKLLLLILTVPLLLYFVPYASAAISSSSYVVYATQDGTGNSATSAAAVCSTGDYATGGGAEETGATTGFVFSSKPQFFDGSSVTDITTGQPNAWFGGVETADGSASVLSFGIRVWVVCQSPITVAGVTVPEFGSLYVAIALAAALYFVMSTLRQRRTPTVRAAK